MDDILDEIVNREDLDKFEKAYSEELHRNAVTDKTKFEYAWCLVKSKYPVDIGKGIILLNELCRNNENDRRDYMYYLAIGHARMKKYTKANDVLNAILRTEPTNTQVLALQKQIKERMNKEAMIGAAKAGGALVVVGGLAGIAFSLMRSSK